MGKKQRPEQTSRDLKSGKQTTRAVSFMGKERIDTWEGDKYKGSVNL